MVRKAAAQKPVIKGSKGSDALNGGAASEAIKGLQGDDTLTGNGGSDLLSGGAGADRFTYLSLGDSNATTGVDHIEDFNLGQGDVVDLSALGTALLQPAFDQNYQGLQAVLSYNAASKTTTLSYFSTSTDPVFEVSFAGKVGYSEAFLGIVTSLQGTEGKDEFLLGNGDLAYGHGGDDYFEGPAGMRAYGGAGDDTFWLTRDAPEAGAYHGGGGTDSLWSFGAVSKDVLDAVKGTSTDQNGDLNFKFSGIENFYGLFSAFIGTDASEHVATEEWIEWTVTVNAGGGDDSIYTGSGDDRITGGAGNDHINGSWGTDTAVYQGNFAEYLISVPASYYSDYMPAPGIFSPDLWGVATIQHIGGSDGTDTLTLVDRLQFADGVYDLTTKTFIPTSAIEGADYLL